MSTYAKILLAFLATMPMTAPFFTDGPLTLAPNLKVRTNENGYLRLSAGTGVTDGPLTNFGNIKIRTNENGYLRVSCDDCGGAVSDIAYDSATWNGNLDAASKNAIRDKIEAIVAGGGLGTNDIDTSAEIASIVTDELGTGKLIFSAGTLAIAAAKTLTVSNILTFTGTDSSSVAFGTGGTVLYTTAISDTVYGAGWDTDTTHAPSKNAIYDKIETLATSAAGSDTYVQYNDGGTALGGESTFAYDKTANLLSIASVKVTTNAGFILMDSNVSNTVGISISSNLTTNRNITLAIDDTTDTALTLPTTGTLTTNAGAATISNKVINGASNTLTVLAASQLSGFVPIGNICTSTNADNTHFLRGDCTWVSIAGGGDALVANPLSQFAATTSAELAGVLSNETGTGVAVFGTNPTLAVPLLNGFRTAFTSKTADYTVSSSDHTVTCDASGTSVTVTLTLPTAASVSGREFQFVRIDTDADGTCVLDGNSSETIDGATTYTMPFSTATTIKSNGTNWIVTSSSGQPLSDPGADRILFWDDSASKLDWLTVSGCTITTTTLTCAGSGTVTATGGSLTSNALVLGAGTVDTKVSTGLTTNGTAQLILGVDSTTAGTVKFWNATSGSVTLTATTGALGTVTLSLPAATDTLMGKATSDVMTNKTLDCAAGTGNVCTFSAMYQWSPAVNQAGTASLGFNTPSSGAATASNVGTTVVAGHAVFIDASTAEVQFNFTLPSYWSSSGTTTIKGKWRSSATSGDAVWQAAGICAADGEVIPTSFSSTPDTATDTTKGTTLQENDFTITLSTSANHALSTCAANEQIYIRLFRDPANGSDTLSATAELLSLMFYFAHVE